ncbi:unnamed protein product [Heligmosomoides polygyrus]|uniref:ALIX_LYPXL_bnd domain-containing protein n=1 Tax=Heligmosomoides polygyrus TaxID=6339 RepID=A0A183G117_HELPZ|nr:unnamed protein product [Heligmosomoides polygyrus]
MSTIRQQIGITKRQLRTALQEAEREHVDLLRISKHPDDNLLNEYERHTSTDDSLYRAYSRFDRLWKQWQLLIASNPEGEEVLQKYVSKHGNFQEILNDAVSTPQKLDKERPLIKAELV